MALAGGEGGMSELRRFPPPEATRSGSAERKPSEILSRTRSVSVFLFGRTSTGPRSSGEVAPISDIPLENVEIRIKQQECSPGGAAGEGSPRSSEKSSLSPFRVFGCIAELSNLQTAGNNRGALRICPLTSALMA